MTYTLNAQAFSAGADMTGRIKAVVYGPKYPSTSITVDVKEFTKLFKDAGESSVITVKGLDADQDVLIHDVQKDVVKGTIIHADLYALQKGQKITVHVPLVFTGVSAAVKLGANLVKVLHEVEVEAEAKNLPHDITIDISSLENMDDQILVSDIKPMPGVEILSEGTEVIAIAAKPVEESEEPVVLDMSAIEISDQKGKKDEEEATA